MGVNDGDIDYNQLANFYLQEHSLEDAIADPDIDIHTLHALIQLKSDELERLIQLQVPDNAYKKYIREFFQKYAFEAVPFSAFCDGLREIGCTDIDSLLKKWYNTRGTPSVIIREIEPRLIKGQETIAKILCNGELTKALTVEGIKCSATAAEKIKAAGGEIR